MKDWVLFHTFDSGHQHEAFLDKGKAWRYAAEIALEYAKECLDGSTCDDVQAMIETGNYEDAIRTADVPAIDHKCNIEVIELEVQ